MIIADSQGDPSKKKRINNRTLLELEEAIKAVEGKTLEELEPTQRNGRYDSEHMLAFIRDAIADYNTDMFLSLRNTILDAIVDIDTDMLLSLRNTILDALNLNREAVDIYISAGVDINIRERYDRPHPLLHQFATADGNAEETRAPLNSPSTDAENVTTQQHTIERQNAPDNPR